jgi:N-acetylmuramoyl-L-alanine amidase
MIIVMKKNNILLILLIFLLSIAIYSLKLGADESKPVIGENTQKVVILDPGHGGEDPGAVSDYSGLKEKDVNLIIANKVKELLEKENYKVIMTRTEDKLVYQPGTTSVTEMRRQDLHRRKKMMDESGANIVVSIHLNKFKETQYYGAQTFYPHNSFESQKLAMSIQKAIKETVDPSNKREALVRGKPNELPIIILRDLKTTTAIVECGFLSNSNEEKLLASSGYEEKLAMAIKQGICNYFSK